MTKNTIPKQLMSLIALTYTWVDRIGMQVNTSIDKMISQIFRGLPKFVYVGDINGFRTISFTPICCVRPKIQKTWTLYVNSRFLIYRPD